MANIPQCYRRRLLPVLTCSLVLLAATLEALPAADEEPSTEPRILLFRVLPTVVDGTQVHEFHWEVANTHRVKLFRDGSEMGGRSQQPDGSVGWDLSMSGALRMRLKATATFELVAEDEAGNSVRQSQVAEVGVRKEPGKRPGKEPGKRPGKEPGKQPAPPAPPGKLPSPSIQSFRVSPAMAAPGDEIKFYWEVENAQSIRLFEGDHEIDLRGLEDTLSTGGAAAFLTTIDETTTFRLEATDRARRATSKSFLVQVRGSAEPAETCSVRGQLEGKWRQQVRERPTGPESTWTVAIYVFADGSSQPVSHATVDPQGTYRISDLTAGKSYRLRPNWDSVPRQGNVSCSAGQTQEGPRFRITGRPLTD